MSVGSLIKFTMLLVFHKFWEQTHRHINRTPDHSNFPLHLYKQGRVIYICADTHTYTCVSTSICMYMYIIICIQNTCNHAKNTP